MKTTKAKTPSCFVSLPTQAQAEEQFRRKIKKPAEGANAFRIERFLSTMERCRATLKSWTIDDIAYIGRGHELSYQEIAELLKIYVDVNVRCGRIEIVQGVYDSPTYLWLA